MAGTLPAAGGGCSVATLPVVLLLRDATDATDDGPGGRPSAGGCVRGGANEGLTRPFTGGAGPALLEGPGVWTCPGAAMGLLRSVERLTMSFPCTTRLSLDRFKSRVIIAREESCGQHSSHPVNATILRQVKPTVSANVQLHDRSDPDVDDAQESLVFLLELLLIEDLHREDAILRDLPINRM